VKAFSLYYEQVQAAGDYPEKGIGYENTIDEEIQPWYLLT
jgi:hypothetical protein